MSGDWIYVRVISKGTSLHSHTVFETGWCRKTILERTLSVSPWTKRHRSILLYHNFHKVYFFVHLLPYFFFTTYRKIKKKNKRDGLICIFAGQFRPAGHISPTSGLNSHSEYVYISGNMPFSRRLILSGYRTRLFWPVFQQELIGEMFSLYYYLQNRYRSVRLSELRTIWKL